MTRNDFSAAAVTSLCEMKPEFDVPENEFRNEIASENRTGLVVVSTIIETNHALHLFSAHAPCSPRSVHGGDRTHNLQQSYLQQSCCHEDDDMSKILYRR